MSRRERRKQAKRSDKSIGIVLGVVGFLLIGALGGGAWWLRTSRVALDQKTYCPTTGPMLVHVLLIDRSDPISGQQAQRIRQVVQDLKNAARFGSRFDVYTFDGDEKSELSPVLSICSPGLPEDANVLIENPELIRRRYEEQFSSVIDRVIDSLLLVSTRPTSPIIESLKAAALSSFGGSENSRIPRHVVMISDMIQNTQAYSQLRSNSDFSQLSRIPAWPSLRPNFRGADVDILYLLRPTALRSGQPIQNRGHQAFWEQLIRDSNGHLLKIEPL